MKRMLLAWLVVGAIALIACGGSKKGPESATGASTAPPSGSAPATGGTTKADMAPTATSDVSVSDNVAKGIKAIDAGDLVSAKAYFDAALRKNPKDVEALYYLGYAAEKGGDKAAAEKSYKDALKIRSDHE